MKQFLKLSSMLILIGACKQEHRRNFTIDNIDSIAILKREDGQLYSEGTRFIVGKSSIFDTIYQSYLNSGKHLKDYYIKIPAGRYLLTAYRSSGKNDTVFIWKDMARVSDVGVIKLERNIEPFLDSISASLEVQAKQAW